jgi:hypothetical protein
MDDIRYNYTLTIQFVENRIDKDSINRIQQLTQDMVDALSDSFGHDAGVAVNIGSGYRIGNTWTIEYGCAMRPDSTNKQKFRKTLQDFCTSVTDIRVRLAEVEEME